MNKTALLIANGFLPVPASTSAGTDPGEREQAVGTVLSNLAHYGFVPSAKVLEALMALDAAALGGFWKEVRPDFEAVTGADRNMTRHVVYKNFPREVLEMSEARYWISQVLMYWGLPNELFVEDPKRRRPLKENADLKVLELADDRTPAVIYGSLEKLPARWNDSQREWALALFDDLGVERVEVDDFGFKENGILIARRAMDGSIPVSLSTATDVLRLAAAMSDGDIALREKVEFRRFARRERKALLDLLVGCRNSVDDFALRPEVWKRLLSRLHPGEWPRYRSVSAAYDRLYRRDYRTFASLVEAGLRDRDEGVLDVLKTRPGEFMRRLHKAYAAFGARAIDTFVEVAPKLDTAQLVKLGRYLATINDRKLLLYAPKGNWGRAKLAENGKARIAEPDLRRLDAAISGIVEGRLAEMFPDGFSVADDVAQVKLQTNDQKLAAYGRGTVFPIPEDVTFIRTASFWQYKMGSGNVWFDNSWNFFDAAWKPVGTCCWDETHEMMTGAVFSGDPTNSKDLKGRACQMIDLYPEALLRQGVRYAVWNVLCYSKVPFNQADDVLATLQWGADAERGRLYEPARAQMVFPLKGDKLTKFVAYVDLAERKLVYLDADFGGSVRSATRNAERLSKLMPAVEEYLDSLPSVGDLFRRGRPGSIPVLYSDADTKLDGGQAYVFRRVNAENQFDGIDLAPVLGG